MNNCLKISVVIPSFNSGKYLIEAVKSINSSAKQPAEIIIVDDCSSDGLSFDIAKDLEARFSNIKVLQTTCNLGAMNARREGVIQSREPYLLFLDSDDYLELNSLEVLLNSIGNNDCCLLDRYIFNGEVSYLDIDLKKISFPIDGFYAGSLTFNGYSIHSRGLYLRNKIASIYMNFEYSAYINADEILSRYILRSLDSIVKCDKRYYVRVNPTSSSRLFSKRTISIAYSFQDIYNFAKVGGYLNSGNHYEGYIWADAIRFFWFIQSKKNELAKMGLWNQAEIAIKENLFKVSRWNIGQHFWRIKKSFFFKLKIFLRYLWLMLIFK